MKNLVILAACSRRLPNLSKAWKLFGDPLSKCLICLQKKEVELHKLIKLTFNRFNLIKIINYF